jgi:predicted dehydrogenase
MRGVADQLRVGVLGAAWIAGRAVIPALAAARNARAVAIASRSFGRAEEMAAAHGIERVYGSYERLLEDREVDAIYLPLVNSLHREWTLAALAAGKHVLCEKPLAMNAADAQEMAAAAEHSRLTLMEAFMYRFHPRMRALREEEPEVVHLAARFGFPLDAPGNYRLDAELGGGALLDVGCYGLNAARWFLGEPEQVTAIAHRAADGLDLSIAVSLGFPGGATASVWGSFESPEDQELVLVERGAGTRHLEKPFTSWRDPDDPYRLMVEAFAEAVLTGGPAPISPADSIAQAQLVDAVRASAGLS